jgi:dihydrolipoamide dehydrogenase
MAATPERFDVVVIGAGPGGYIAAIRCAQLGFRTACIDDWTRAGGKPAPGGTCTNVGCIPSKALLQSSEHFEHAGTPSPTTDTSRQPGDRRRADAGAQGEGRRAEQRRHPVPLQEEQGDVLPRPGSFSGGSFEAGWNIAVESAKPATLAATHVIVATGSAPRPLPGVAFDNVRVLDNAGALAIPDVPKRLGVVGAGVIGLEMGSVWRRLGSDTTILEALPTFLGAADEAVAKEAKRVFAKQGLIIHTGVTITGVETGADDVVVRYNDADGNAQRATYDRLIVAIGRVPHTEGLGRMP